MSEPTNNSRQRFRRDELIVGRLHSHGPAPYDFRDEEAASYYMKVLTNRGEKILWGKDLVRAIAQSATHVKVGDMIGARRTGAETFAFGDRTVRRYRWVVEHAQFFADRARDARRLRERHEDTRAALEKRPELKSGFLSMRAAHEFAERQIPNPQDRKRFLEGVQSAINGSILKGMPLPNVRLRENSTKIPTLAKRADRDRSR
jgi:hypothetical protein